MDHDSASMYKIGSTPELDPLRWGEAIQKLLYAAGEKGLTSAELSSQCRKEICGLTPCPPGPFVRAMDALQASGKIHHHKEDGRWFMSMTARYYYEAEQRMAKVVPVGKVNEIKHERARDMGIIFCRGKKVYGYVINKFAPANTEVVESYGRREGQSLREFRRMLRERVGKLNEEGSPLGPI